MKGLRPDVLSSGRPTGVYSWISFSPVFSCMCCTVRDLSCGPNIYMYASWSTSILRARLLPLNMFKPSSNFFTGRSQASFVDHFLLFMFCFCFVVLSAPRSHVSYQLGKCWPLGPLVCCVFLCFCHFPYGVLFQVWYLIVSIPDLCFPFCVRRVLYLNILCAKFQNSS